jgi:hypothetical protein
MAWTAAVISKQKVSGKVQILVRVTDGSLTFDQYFTADFHSATVEWLKGAVTDWIGSISDSYALADAITVGAFDLTPASATPAEVARANFRADCILMRRYAKAKNAGIITGTEQFMVDLKERLLANYLPAYIDLLELLP